MGTFTATTQVDRIGWDFNDTPQRDDGTKLIEHEALVGTLPEPSPVKMRAFLDASQEIHESVAVAIAAATGREMDEDLQRVSDTIAKALDVETIEANDCYAYAAQRQEETLVDLGLPADLASQLPARHLRAFFDYVTDGLVGEGDGSSSDGSAG